MIIGICGLQGSGKDTLAQILIDKYNFEKLSFASKLKDIVLDCFLGSGSTMVASHQLKRKCYGMELDPKYCDVIVRRMINLDNTLSVKRNGIDCKSEFE